MGIEAPKIRMNGTVGSYLHYEDYAFSSPPETNDHVMYEGRLYRFNWRIGKRNTFSLYRVYEQELGFLSEYTTMIRKNRTPPEPTGPEIDTLLAEEDWINE